MKRNRRKKTRNKRNPIQRNPIQRRSNRQKRMPLKKYVSFKTESVKKDQNKTKKKDKIIDVLFSKKKHLGTLASSNEIEYNYQNIKNIIRFFELMESKGKIENVGFFPSQKIQGGTPGKKFGENYSLLKVLNPGSKKTTVTPWFLTQTQYKKEFKLRKERFVPILVHCTGKLIKDHSVHANILLIDNERKIIEFFEPHGYKKEFSTPSDPVTQYHKKYKALKDYWKKITPKYEFINASDVLGKRNFQTKYDSGSGYCTVWSGIFAHYRLLNPDTPLKDLMIHIDKKIKVANLLKYARYVEDTVKRKI